MFGALLSPLPGSSRIFDALLAEQGAAADGTSLRAMDRYAEADSGKLLRLLEITDEIAEI